MGDTAMRILLLIFSGILLIGMAGCPGLYDSKRSKKAQREYSDAERLYQESPSVESEQRFSMAENALMETRRLDRRKIIKMEIIMGCLLTLSLVLFKSIPVKDE